MGRPAKYNDKENWLQDFEKQRPDLVWPESWSEDEKAEAADMVRPSQVRSSMFAKIPMVCKGNRCPFASQCPLLAKNLAPVSRPCPIEMTLVVEAMNGYMEELNVDENNFVEVSMVRDLVNQEVQMQRATWELSDKHFIQENVVGLDSDGHPVMKKELNLAVELEDKLHKRRKDLRNQLMATREAKAKIGQGAVDVSQSISKTLEAIRQLEINKEKLTKKKLGLVEKDDYIEADSQELDNGDSV